MAGATFEAEILLQGKTATYFHVPDDAVAALGAGKRLPVVVSINHHTYRSTIAPMGGENVLPLNRENRAGAAVTAGDRVEVRLELDAEPRVVEVPADLAEALAAEPPSATRFDTLSYSHRREYVEWIEEAKRPETRQRRITRTVDMLRNVG